MCYEFAIQLNMCITEGIINLHLEFLFFTERVRQIQEKLEEFIQALNTEK